MTDRNLGRVGKAGESLCGRSGKGKRQLEMGGTINGKRITDQGYSL